MPRFLSLFFALFLFAVSPVLADGPPISGDMVKLVPYKDKPPMTKVMLSSQDEGLAYLSDFRGRLIILNIWATWCPPCIHELPSLNALQYAMGGDKLKVITVSLDTAGPKYVKKYLEDKGLSGLTSYIDVNQDLQKLSLLKGVPGIPVTLILDPQMRALARVEGDADWNGPAARAVIEYYLDDVLYY